MPSLTYNQMVQMFEKKQLLGFYTIADLELLLKKELREVDITKTMIGTMLRVFDYPHNGWKYRMINNKRHAERCWFICPQIADEDGEYGEFEPVPMPERFLISRDEHGVIKARLIAKKKRIRRTCPIHKIKLVERHVGRAKFLTCPRYPNCTVTQSLGRRAKKPFIRVNINGVRLTYE